MSRGARISRPVSVAILAFLVAGCAAHDLRAIDPARRGDDRIAALADGATKREDVLEAWGEPSSSFERGDVLSYRLDRGFKVVRASSPGGSEDEMPASRWVNATYDLVLVFDRAGVLQRHRLLQVR